MEATDAGQEGSRAGERRMSNEDVADTKEDRMSDAAMISKTGGRRQSGDYAALRSVLDEAFLQSAEGKGNARHANDKPFGKQPILEIGRMVGPGFAAGQIMKKAQEAIGMAARGETEAAANELLGAIVYAASAVVLVREKPVAVEADASRLIEPDVAPRPFKVEAGKSYLTRGGLVVGPMEKRRFGDGNTEVYPWGASQRMPCAFTSSWTDLGAFHAFSTDPKLQAFDLVEEV